MKGFVVLSGVLLRDYCKQVFGRQNTAEATPVNPISNFTLQRISSKAMLVQFQQSDPKHLLWHTGICYYSSCAQKTSAILRFVSLTNMQPRTTTRKRVISLTAVFYKIFFPNILLPTWKIHKRILRFFSEIGVNILSKINWIKFLMRRSL